MGSTFTDSIRHSVLVTSDEARLLSQFLQSPADAISTDGFGVYVRSGIRTLALRPKPEGVPDEKHPIAEVCRVQPAELGGSEAKCDVLCEAAGGISNIAITTTLISFTTPQEVAESEMTHGVATVQKEIGYSFVCWHPDGVEWTEEAARATTSFSRVDVGVVISTTNRRILIATNGIGYFLKTDLDEFGRETLSHLEGHFALTALSART